ncbi:MAG: hypothetical protein FWD24_07780 [Treponema sp.]|nr:hypothetical protein [Treponema sp.]
MFDKKFLIIFIFLIIIFIIHAQDTIDNNIYDEEYYDFESLTGITIIGERPREFLPDSIEANVLSALNSTSSRRKHFIENDLLINSGFRSSANIRFRETDVSEKALSILHGIARPLSFGIVPALPFSEIEYGRLPNGFFYSFETVINSSELNNISPVVLAVMKIEYMLQIEFCNGILIRNNIYNNSYYYTEENINRFERLILELPEYPESIKQFKERLLDIELPKIRGSYLRHNNPNEDYLRAVENLINSFRN